MYFGMKSYLKSNHNHTIKQTLYRSRPMGRSELMCSMANYISLCYNKKKKSSSVFLFTISKITPVFITDKFN
jgi:hypothetical protein